MTAKLDRPPYAHNWVRYNFPDELATAKALVAFATNIPQITYVAGGAIVRDRIARTPEVWRRGDYELLNDKEMKAQTEIYLRALSRAKLILSERQAAAKEKSVEPVVTEDTQQNEFEI
jgi:hypothetical protein